jgi:ubiquinone/menaquinone biosynthesis C-methylase UbiE
VSPKKPSAKPKKKKTGVAPGYLHGYSPEEQERLYRQARFLEPKVFEGVEYRPGQKILEVGCGVGAQTEILLRRYPGIQVQGVDASRSQVERARRQLKDSVRSGRVAFETADALHLPFDDDSFDGAFVCWFLEHVQAPVEILREVRRVLKADAVLFCNEVLNATFYVHPYSPATLRYWFAFNDHQWELKGDPFVGGKLANYLLAAGYQNVETRVATFHYDNRAPKQRAAFIEYWTSLLLSGAPGLIEAGKVTRDEVQAMKRELEHLKNHEDSVIFYSFVKARAQAF